MHPSDMFQDILFSGVQLATLDTSIPLDDTLDLTIHKVCVLEFDMNTERGLVGVSSVTIETNKRIGIHVTQVPAENTIIILVTLDMRAMCAQSIATVCTEVRWRWQQ
jgi:hypothetical protein